jgi:hypothetical protein
VDEGIKRSVHEAHVDLILYYVELFLVFFRTDFSEHFRDLGFTESYNAFVLEIGAEGDFDKALVGSSAEY